MKKRILMIALGLMLCLSSFAMFACKDKGNSEETSAQYKTTITKMTSEEDSTFKTGTIYGVSTNFYLNDFVEKDKMNIKHNSDDNYIALTAVAMNYIKKYGDQIANIKGSFDYKTLENNLKSLDEKFVKMQKTHKDLTFAGDNVSYVIYNGYFTNYKLIVKDFISQLYTTAVNLGDLVINQTGISEKIAKGQTTAEENTSYYDYQILLVFSDYYKFFIESCEGNKLTTSLYTTVRDEMKAYCINLVGKTVTAMTAEKTKQFSELSKALGNERKSLSVSVEEVKLYDLQNKYEGSIDAYAKDEINARSYYDEYERYFTVTNNYITVYYDFIMAI